MSEYTIDDLESALEQRGELLLALDSDGYPSTPELHLHDTTFRRDPPEVIVELSDGEWSFKPDRIESIAVHKQSTEELGF